MESFIADPEAVVPGNKMKPYANRSRAPRNAAPNSITTAGWQAQQNHGSKRL
jgi:hypothetical protein